MQRFHHRVDVQRMGRVRVPCACTCLHGTILPRYRKHLGQSHPTVLSEFHGIDGIALGVPHVVGADGAFPLHRTAMTDLERDLLSQSASALGATLAELSS